MKTTIAVLILACSLPASAGLAQTPPVSAREPSPAGPGPGRAAQPSVRLLLGAGGPAYGGSYAKLAGLAYQMGYAADLGTIHSSEQLGEYRGLVVRAFPRLQEVEFLRRFIENGGRVLVWVDRPVLPPHGERADQTPASAVTGELDLLRTVFLATWFELPVLLEDLDVPVSSLNGVPMWRGYNLAIRNDSGFHGYLNPGPDYRALCRVVNPENGQERVLAVSRQLGAGEVMVVILPEDNAARASDPFDDTNIGLQANSKAAAETLRWLAGER
jgi:hypothetical protein